MRSDAARVWPRPTVHLLAFAVVTRCCCRRCRKSEIVHIHKRFATLRDGLSVSPVAFDVLQEIPELRHNPFKDRILRVFSDDGTGDLLFGERVGARCASPPRTCCAAAFIGRRSTWRVGVH